MVFIVLWSTPHNINSFAAGPGLVSCKQLYDNRNTNNAHGMHLDCHIIISVLLEISSYIFSFLHYLLLGLFFSSLCLPLPQGFSYGSG